MAAEDSDEIQIHALGERVSRLELRVEGLQDLVHERREHAHSLDLEQQRLAVKFDGMNETMQHVLTGVAGNQKGIRSIETAIHQHVADEQKQRAVDAETARSREDAERRHRSIVNVSVVAVLISSFGALFGIVKLLSGSG